MNVTTSTSSRIPDLYRWKTSFVDPAVLGAGIAWWVQGLGTFFDGSIPSPTGWSLCFGLWFLAYYATWYFHELVEAAGEMPGGYGTFHLIADMLDVIVIPVAFLGLGFATGNYDRTALGLSWAAALAVPVVALVHNYSTMRDRPLTFLPVLATVAVPVCALIALRAGFSGTSGVMSWCLLAVFWGILIAYMRWPESFSSRRKSGILSV